MLLSLQWLREFVPYEGSVEELAHRLTMIGNEVEEIFDPFERLAGLVVGHVVECGPHPQADKLSVCRVDVGDEVLDIVCGAPNVAKGQKVAVAKVGASLPGDFRIKKAKIRGVASHGMICSERELELSDDHEGIMVLGDGLAPGESFVDALGFERTVLDVGITPNRADCLSVLGLARETAAAFGLPLTMPEPRVKEVSEKAADLFRIEIPEPEYCPLYMARILKGITLDKSPEWMSRRLLAVGMRPINNIVDVTNYVLMELGQPLHAFDMDLLEGGVVKVARSLDGMAITTLDGQSRKLLDSDLLIWDDKKPVALAGVMGGENTEINEKSDNVLLECAVFRPASIRKTARRLALPSEASYRFERGVDQVGSRFALERAAALMAELAGGDVLSGIAEAEPVKWTSRVIPFRHERCNRLMGHGYTEDFSRETLTGLGCDVEEAADQWTVTAPSWRLDLEREVDLFEEVARMYGMDRIEAVIPRVSKSEEAVYVGDTEFGFLRSVKDWARGAGLREAVNYSFVGTQDLDRLGLPEEDRVPVANPLSEDQNVLRTRLAPGLLNTLRQNLAQAGEHVRVFEVARIFHPDSSSDTATRESNRLGLLLYGPRHASEWPWPGESADYLDLKGLVEHLLESLHLGPAAFVRVRDHAYLEPCVRVELDGEPVGELGRVKPKIADHYHARRDVWIKEMDLDALMALCRKVCVEFESLPVFPPVRRDVTLLSPTSLQAADVEKALDACRSKLLQNASLVAVYQPEDNPDQRNLSFRLTYRHPSKTLKDKEVDKEHGRIVESLKKELGVRV